MSAQSVKNDIVARNHSLWQPMLQPMAAGSTPKQTRSLSESIWMPKRFSASVRPFFVRAMRPSNASSSPASIRHSMASSGSLCAAE